MEEWRYRIRKHKRGGKDRFTAYDPDIPRCFAEGRTQHEALYHLSHIRQVILEHLREHNLPVPKPGDGDNEKYQW